MDGESENHETQSGRELVPLRGSAFSLVRFFDSARGLALRASFAVRVRRAHAVAPSKEMNPAAAGGRNASDFESQPNPAASNLRAGLVCHFERSGKSMLLIVRDFSLRSK